MYFDRFDIAEAYYLALTHCHGGQNSKSYARLCKLSQSFRPAPGLDVDELSDNGREIYENACKKLLAAY